MGPNRRATGPPLLREERIGVWLIGVLLMAWAGVEAWWVSAKVPAQKPGVAELLDALWWLPGPEPGSWTGSTHRLADDVPSSQEPIHVDQLDSAGWTQHGLSPRQAASALRYRDAVGGFRDMEVLGRMRVLPEGWLEHHEARLVFPVRERSKEALAAASTPLQPTRGGTQKRERVAHSREALPSQGQVPLNTADSLELIALRGVGPWVAGRILQARRSWGGFADTAQLVEALGWDSLARSIMPMFSCDPDQIERRCPDSLTVEGWSALPGVRRREAEAIVRYVGQHGGDLNGLSACLVLDSMRWERLFPYLECGASEDP